MEARPPEAITVSRFGGLAHEMPRYDGDVLAAEVDLLCDWYWPLKTGAAMPQGERERFRALWRALIDEVACFDHAFQLTLKRERSYRSDDWYVNLQRSA